MIAHPSDYKRHPVAFVKALWKANLYDRQERVLESVRDFYETLVPAANMVGKDFVTALLILWFFLTREPCRVIFTSVDHTQLATVLWGEIRRFIQECNLPLTVETGGPLQVNFLNITREGCPLSYIRGRVAQKGEGMLGHHVPRQEDGIPRTLFVCDEASGVDDVSWERAGTWAERRLAIGNPYPCSNFFYRGIQQGSDKYRNIIRIRAEDSPNVRFALAQQRRGQEPTGESACPGVLPWAEYQKRRETWDKVQQTIGLDAEFHEGEETTLFPPEWFALCRQNAVSLRQIPRSALAIGVDPGDVNTLMAAADRQGVIDLRRAANGGSVVGEIIAFGMEHQCTSNFVVDRGGGGKLLADELRAKGYAVRTVGFGEPVVIEAGQARHRMRERMDQRETRYVFKNRRAQLFGELRELVRAGFAMDDEELIRQLKFFPLLYDSEGRLCLLSKLGKTPDEDSLTRRIGKSPDEADAVALAVHGILHEEKKVVVGAAW